MCIYTATRRDRREDTDLPFTSWNSESGQRQVAEQRPEDLEKVIRGKKWREGLTVWWCGDVGTLALAGHAVWHLKALNFNLRHSRVKVRDDAVPSASELPWAGWSEICVELARIWGRRAEEEGSGKVPGLYRRSQGMWDVSSRKNLSLIGKMISMRLFPIR